jgi:hypothetical protein
MATAAVAASPDRRQPGPVVRRPMALYQDDLGSTGAADQ